jgi:hypothetical protein
MRLRGLGLRRLLCASGGKAGVRAASITWRGWLLEAVVLTVIVGVVVNNLH